MRSTRLVLRENSMAVVANSKSNISLSNEARIAFVAYGVDTLNETANPYYVVTELVSAMSEPY